MQRKMRLAKASRGVVEDPAFISEDHSRPKQTMESEMIVKVLELRDAGTFIPVICIKPVPENEGQRYLLRRDGYSCNPMDRLVIMINAQCRGAAYDPYDWRDARTKRTAHIYIQEKWEDLRDGDVIDVQFLLGETDKPKVSERETAPC